MKRSINFSDKAIEIVENYAQEHSCNFNQAVNSLICSKSEINTEAAAKLFLKLFDEHYSKLLTRLRLGVSETDKNVQVIIEILNSFLYYEKKEYSLMPTEIMSHSVVTEAKEQIKERITRFKQINDNKKNKREQEARKKK